MTADRPVELNVRRSIIKRKAPTQSTIEPKGENYDKTTIMLRWATAFLVAIQWLIGRTTNFLQRGAYIWSVPTSRPRGCRPIAPPDPHVNVKRFRPIRCCRETRHTIWWFCFDCKHKIDYCTDRLASPIAELGRAGAHPTTYERTNPEE